MEQLLRGGGGRRSEKFTIWKLLHSPLSDDQLRCVVRMSDNPQKALDRLNAYVSHSVRIICRALSFLVYNNIYICCR